MTDVIMPFISFSIPSANHHTKPSLRALHLCILLQQPRVLHFRITILKFVLLSGLPVTIACVTRLAAILSILLVLNNRLDFIVFELAVA